MHFAANHKHTLLSYSTYHFILHFVITLNQRVVFLDMTFESLCFRLYKVCVTSILLWAGPQWKEVQLKRCIEYLQFNERDIEFCNIVSWFQGTPLWKVQTKRQIERFLERVEGQCSTLSENNPHVTYYFHNYTHFSYNKWTEEGSNLSNSFLQTIFFRIAQCYQETKPQVWFEVLIF